MMLSPRTKSAAYPVSAFRNDVPSMDLTRRLPQIAAKLGKKARATGLSAADLEDQCPWLCRQIVRDAATPGLLDLWNSSSNFDELAGVAIVEPGVLAAIGELAGVSVDGLIVHAGLQHTYGYLLSTIVTPFGYKRDRWVSPRLEQGFGLPSDILGPNPVEGTLLSNATLFAGLVAFRGDEQATRRLRRIAPSAAAPIRKLDFTHFEHRRIVETLSPRDSAGRFRSVRIRTDVVPYPCQVGGCVENCLLVYSIEDSSQPGPRLTTLFPVSPTFVAELTHPNRFGPAVEIRTRFNAFVPGLAGQTLVGRRTLEEFHRRDRTRPRKM
ncbi:MAG: hypothetical protein JWN70_2923 [Planctomycetaceae bacterium]|nr:hypothetical protein [Planctomycetaceae bacterium]